MPLASGTQLGPYEILSALGAGGMGEVYRARDTKLDRDVAIKILPQVFVADPERVARFQREAKTLASLNHPHIGGIYGLEERGGVTALVMELVEGEDLSQRIARGAIPLDEALPIAKQIAEALEAAHEQGIIHRDLKPANIKVRSDGTVKVLDFGLAKAMEQLGSAPNVSQSPTITTPAMMTGVGVILGTAAYMSPEQARGKTVDKRADIWAFGAVLFEMLTGKRAFDGEDVSDTLAAVLRAEPDWSALPPDSSPTLRRLLRRCLEKDRTRRLHDIGDARLELEESQALTSDVLPITSSPQTGRRRTMAALGAGIVGGALLAGVIAWRVLVASSTGATTTQRFTIAIPATAPYIGEQGAELALSPDGRHLVFVALVAGKRILYRRDLNQLEVQPIHGSDDAWNPFFSPDGQWVGFFTAPPAGDLAARRVNKIALRGGPPVTIAGQHSLAGGSWGDDNTIVFPSSLTGPATTSVLVRVAAAGGEPQALTTLDAARQEQGHAWPEFLPGAAAVLFTVRTGRTYDVGAHIAVLSLTSGKYHTVVEQGYHARYVSTGHILYMLGSTLMAVRFDLDTLRTTGAPAPVAEGIRGQMGTAGEANFVVSRTGFLVYAPGSVATGGPLRQLMWVDRQGREQALRAPPRSYTYPRLSPDGTQVALDVRDSDGGDIWVLHLASGILDRVTTNRGLDFGPVWTASGSRLVFGSTRGDVQNLRWQQADGTASQEWLAESAQQQFPTAFSPDGKHVIFEENRRGSRDVLMLSVADRRVVPLLETSYHESNGDVSPNGRWLAYQSDESGRPEIYVRSFPDVNRIRRPVSSDGGTRPRWSSDGHELFYLVELGPNRVRLMASPVQTATSFSAERARPLFEGPYFTAVNGRPYDVSSDGQRFLMIKDEAYTVEPSGPSHFVVVLNWFDELKRLVPTK